MTKNEKANFEMEALKWTIAALKMISNIRTPDEVKISADSFVSDKWINRRYTVTINTQIAIYEFWAGQGDLIDDENPSIDGICGGLHGLIFNGVRYESDRDAPAEIRKYAESWFRLIKSQIRP